MYRRCCVFLFALCFYNLHSQHFEFKIFKENQGLAQSYVYAVNQLANDYVAVGTGGGLSITGGAGFKNYTKQNGLSDNIVTAIEYDAQGITWFGHFLGGLTFLKNDSLYAFQPFSNKQKKINTLLSFQSRLWIGNSEDKVYYIDNQKLFEIKLPGCKGINSFSIFKNSLLVATGNGIYVQQSSAGKENFVRVPKLDGVDVTALYNSGDTLLFFGTSSGEIYTTHDLHETTNQTPKILYSFPEKSSVRAIEADANGCVWVGAFGEGMLQIRLNTVFLPTPEIVTIKEENGLNNLSISCLMRDRENNLWIGTYGDGIYLLQPDKLVLYDEKNGLKDQDVLSVVSFGKYLISGTTNGIQVCELPGGKFSTFYTKGSGFIDDEVRCMAVYSSDRVLVGTRFNGAYFFNPELKKFAKIPITPTGINFIQVRNDTVVVFSTSEGVSVYNPTTKAEFRYTTLQGLPHNQVLQTASGRSDKIWIACRQSPLSYLEKGEIKIRSDINKFNSFNISCLCITSEDKLYFGTSGNGLFYDTGNNFNRVTEEQGLQSNFINGLVFDETQQVLICTHVNGITEWNLKQNHFQRLDGRENSMGCEFKSNAIYKASSGGLIFFGTSKGVGVYRQELDKDVFHPLVLKMESISINKIKYRTELKEVNLPFGAYDITLNYLAITHRNNDQVRYEYQLEGLSSETRSTFSRELNFSQLNEGKYILRIFAVSAEGIKNKTPYILRITISPPFYRSVWFIFSIVIFSLLLLWMFYRQRVWRLKKLNALLEKKVMEKTEEIQQDKNYIEKINIDLKNKNEEITAGISYAKRIQLALLPKSRHIQSKLDSVVFFRPRDIVSGDFYWFRETASFFYLAVGDCTGHGVPAAFMSLIGSNLLDRIIDESNVADTPSQILYAIDKEILSLLKQKSSESKLLDGMDLALLRITKDKKEVVFSGASRPLWIIRGEEFIETSPNPYSLGGYFPGIKKSFSDHKISIQTGDALYFFSEIGRAHV